MFADVLATQGAGASATMILTMLNRGNKNICLHFIYFLHTDMTQVVETPCEVEQELTYST